MKKIILVLLVIGIYSCHKNTTVYPKTEKVNQIDDYFGTKVKDPYRWLEDDKSEKTKKWVEIQNKVTFDYLHQIPIRAKIKNRLTELFNYPKTGIPYKIGDYYFISKNNGLQNQYVTYYKKGENGKEVEFLNPNKLSDKGTISASLSGASKDNKYVVISTKVAGSDWAELTVKKIKTNKILPDIIKKVKFSGASWYKDGFFYSRFPEVKGSKLSVKNEYHSVYYHKLGTSQSQDKLIYKSPKNPLLYNYISVTKDEKYFILRTHNGTEGNKIYFAKANKNIKPKWIPLISKFGNKSYVIAHKKGKFFLMTNIDAPNNRLVSIDPKKPTKENWKDIIPTKNILLSSVSFGGRKIFANYLENAATQIYQMDLDGTHIKKINLPTVGSAFGFSGKDKDEKLFYSFSSFTYPPTIFQYDIKTKKSQVYYSAKLKFNPSDYETKQIWFNSKDSTKIPMFITYKKGLKKDGKRPTLLYGYGGFNISLRPRFSTSNIILLENGGVYAQATLRGGGEFGEKWHKDGMLMNKQNVFDDFISAGEKLIEMGFTSKEFLAIEGRSNGGLLVGACMTQKPNLFKVAFPGVGVLDMLRYHKFTVGWGWIPEYGSAQQSKQMFDYLYKYSPLHNVKKGINYPATMVTTADHDDRVVPAHSFKFISELQEKHSGENPVLIRIEVNAGHGAGKPISKILDEQADKWSFMLHNMNIKTVK